MSIARVVDHLYVINRREERIAISFLTNRVGWFIPIFLVSVICFAVVWTAFHFQWNDNLISGIVGGSLSMVAVTCFAVAEHITRYIVIIEPDVVSFQREFEGIPLGAKKIYSRAIISDLGMYPGENRKRSGLPFKWGRLCLWVAGKSIEIESFFPITEGVSLAEDLRKLGIEFPRTFPSYNEEHLLFAGTLDYFSF